MSSFTTQLSVSPLDDGKNWILNEEFSYHVGHKNSLEIITVPKGFKTDFASIPRIFWIFLIPTGKCGKASVIHDYLYRTTNHVYERKTVDDIFLESMKVLKVSYLQRKIIYYVVRLFGVFAWNKHHKK